LAVVVPIACKREANDAEVAAALNEGVGLAGQYRHDEAAQAIGRVLAKSPGHTQARIDLALATFNRKAKDSVQQSGKLLDEVLRDEPENLQALYFRAIVYQHSGQAAASIPLLKRVVDKRPHDGAAWYLLGLAQHRTELPA